MGGNELNIFQRLPKLSVKGSRRFNGPCSYIMWPKRMTKAYDQSV